MLKLMKCSAMMTLDSWKHFLSISTFHRICFPTCNLWKSSLSSLHTKCLSSLFSFFKSLLSRFVERAVHAPWSNWAIEKNFWIGNTICHFGCATVTHCCFTFQKALLFNIAMTNSFLGQSMFVVIHIISVAN